MSLRKKWLLLCVGIAMAVYVWYGFKPAEPAGPPILYAEPLDLSLGSAPAGDTKTKQFKLARDGARQERDRQAPRRRARRLTKDRPAQTATPTWRQEHGPVIAAGEPIAPSPQTNRFATEPRDVRRPPAREPRSYVILGFGRASDNDDDLTTLSQRTAQPDNADAETNADDPDLPTDPALLSAAPEDVTGRQLLAAPASPAVAPSVSDRQLNEQLNLTVAAALKELSSRPAPVSTSIETNSAIATVMPSSMVDGPGVAVRGAAPVQAVSTTSRISNDRRGADQFGRAVAEVGE